MWEKEMDWNEHAGCLDHGGNVTIPLGVIHQNGKRWGVLSARPRGMRNLFVVFCTLISKSPKGGYEHVGGLLFSNTSCCRYIYSGVSEHYLSCRGDNDSMHNQRLMVETMCQQLEYSIMWGFWESGDSTPFKHIQFLIHVSSLELISLTLSVLGAVSVCPTTQRPRGLLLLSGCIVSDWQCTKPYYLVLKHGF